MKRAIERHRNFKGNSRWIGGVEPITTQPTQRSKGRLAEHGAALQAVAPILADRGAALAAFTAIGGLVRLDDHQGVLRNLVPSWLAGDPATIILCPRLSVPGSEGLRGAQVVHRRPQI